MILGFSFLPVLFFSKSLWKSIAQCTDVAYSYINVVICAYLRACSAAGLGVRWITLGLGCGSLITSMRNQKRSLQ